MTCSNDSSLPYPVLGTVSGAATAAQKTVSGAAGSLPADPAGSVAGAAGCTASPATTNAPTADSNGAGGTSSSPASLSAVLGAASLPLAVSGSTVAPDHAAFAG